MVTTSPRGITIGQPGNRKRTWKVGKELGSGACATVCALLNDDGSSTDFAIKLAPIPQKKTKKGNTPEEKNADLLHYEQLIYQTQFQGLQGTVIPSLPNPSNGPPIAGEESGFKFFILEKMDCGLSSIVTQLHQMKPSSGMILFGPAAVKLLTCVQAIHDRNNIIRDVKTENFMLAFGNGQGSSPEEKLASRIRLLDLALASQWTSTYRESIEAENLVGTPLYASLNVHEGKKPSYRDDLEALGYVMAELLMQLNSGDSSMQLPWFSGKSDDDIGAIKKLQVTNPKSNFYRQLGDAETIAVFSEYMNAVRRYTFKQKPDYEELAKILSKLKVPRNSKASPVATTKKVTAAKSSALADTASRVGTKRTKRDKDDASETSNASIPRASRRQKSSGMTIDEDVSFRLGVGHGTIRSEEREDMDWEYTVDENEEPPEESAPAAKLAPLRRSERIIINERPIRRRNNAQQESEDEIIVICDDNDNEVEEKPQGISKKLQRRGLRIDVIEGPHRGDFFEMEAGSSDTLIVGSNPSSNVGTIVALKKDKSLDNTHVRLDLNTKKGSLTALTVTDKSKGGKTFVNRDAVKNTKAFINDTIRIGNTALKIKSL